MQAPLILHTLACGERFNLRPQRDTASICSFKNIATCCVIYICCFHALPRHACTSMCRACDVPKAVQSMRSYRCYSTAISCFCSGPEKADVRERDEGTACPDIKPELGSMHSVCCADSWKRLQARIWHAAHDFATVPCVRTTKH